MDQQTARPEAHKESMEYCEEETPVTEQCNKLKAALCLFASM